MPRRTFSRNKVSLKQRRYSIFGLKIKIKPEFSWSHVRLLLLLFALGGNSDSSRMGACQDEPKTLNFHPVAAPPPPGLIMSDRVLVQKGARSCGITTFLRGSLPNLFTYLGRHVGMYLAVFTLPVFVRLW